jgi:hypothetical protein
VYTQYNITDFREHYYHSILHTQSERARERENANVAR